jgi:hypothetical protein
MPDNYQLSNPNKGFVHTNIKTVEQRAEIMGTLLPGVQSIAEICCGNCFHQAQIYGQSLQVQKYVGLDIDPVIVKMNKQQGVECVQGDALHGSSLKQFLNFDIVFFGPPLSVECDGQQLISFEKVTPGYFDFVELLIGELKFKGTLVCICPKTTTMGDIQSLYTAMQNQNKDFGLSLIHHSFSDVTSRGAITEPRLKYIEIWFSVVLGDTWTVRKSMPKA